MSVFQDLKYFYIAFYIFGQAPYYPLHNRNKIRSKIQMRFPLALLFANIIFCSLILIPAIHNPLKTNNYMVLYIFKYTGLFPTFVVIYVNLFEKFDVWAVNNKIFFLCNFFKVKIDEKVRMETFKSNYYRDLSICILVISFKYTIRIFIVRKYNIIIELAIFTIQFYKMIATVHLLFYVKMFTFVLKSIKNGIASQICGPISTSQVILNSDCHRMNQQHERLSAYFLRARLIHLKLWEVMQIFNACYGWCLTAIMLESVISVTKATYGIFLYFVSNEDVPILIIRKY